MDNASPSEAFVVDQFKASRSVRVARYITPIILWVGDYLAVIAALTLACVLRADILPMVFPGLSPFDANVFYVYICVPAIYSLFFLYEGSYTRQIPLWQGVERVFCVCFYVSALAIIIMYFLGKAEQISRLVVLMSWVFSFVMICGARIGLKRLLIFMGLWQRPVIIMGAGKTAELLCDAFERDKGLGYKVVGVLEDIWQERPLIQQVPYLGSFARAEEVIIESGVQDVILAVPGISRNQLMELTYRIQPIVRHLTIVPDLFGIPMGNMTVDTLFNEKTVLLRVHNNLLRKRNRLIKRIFDVAACCFGGMLMLPVLLFLVAIVAVSSRGPIFFTHQRVGQNGKKFWCYKFRTMRADGDEILKKHFQTHPEAKGEWEREFKLKEDPRVTKVGSWLRKTSLDELPQILNVLKGEMSLVGPRPIVHDEIAKYEDFIQDYYIVKPGITGLWQVSGRNNIDYPERVRMDSWYVRNWSVWMDLILLAKTVGVVLKKEGAY